MWKDRKETFVEHVEKLVLSLEPLLVEWLSQHPLVYSIVDKELLSLDVPLSCIVTAIEDGGWRCRQTA